MLLERPRVRGDCIDGPRPCPWALCRHHLYLEVLEDGALKLNFPGRALEQLEQTCSLDVADEGEQSVERIGELLNLTGRRVQQIEREVVTRLAKQGPPRLDGDEWMTMTEATRKLRCSDAYVSKLAHQGRLRRRMDPRTKHWRYNARDVYAEHQERTRKAEEQVRRLGNDER